jgi:hypothetical protein
VRYAWISKKPLIIYGTIVSCISYCKLNFSVNTVNLISSFLSNKKCKVSVEGELSTSREIKAGVPQGSVLSPLLHNLYINDVPQTPATYLTHCADDTFIYTTDRKEGYVINKLQRGLTSVQSWCERWNIKINAQKTQATCFSRGNRRAESHLTLKGRNIPFVNQVCREDYVKIYLIETIEAKAFRTLIRVYSLFKCEQLSANIKLNYYKALIRSVMTYVCRVWKFAADTHLLKLQRLRNKVLSST